MADIVIFGIGKMADVAFACLRHKPQHRVVAFTVDKQFFTAKEKAGLPVVAFEDVATHYAPKQHALFVAMGYHDLNRIRAARLAHAKALGYASVSIIGHDESTVEADQIGQNCLVLEGRSIQPGARIADDVWVFTGAHVGHHAQIRAHAWLASGAVVGGASVVGEGCFVGLNATVGHGVTIGDYSFLGAGTRVLSTAPAKSVFIERDTAKFRLDSDDFLKITKLG